MMQNSMLSRGLQLTYVTGMSDPTPSRTLKISHPNVRALNKWSSFFSTTCFHRPQLKPAILYIFDTIMGRIKVREVKIHDCESRIQQAIKEKMKKQNSLRDLAILYKIPRSTLSDRLRGIPSRHESQRKHQAISPAVERSLIRWVDDRFQRLSISIYLKLWLPDWYRRMRDLHSAPPG